MSEASHRVLMLGSGRLHIAVIGGARTLCGRHVHGSVEVKGERWSREWSQFKCKVCVRGAPAPGMLRP